MEKERTAQVSKKQLPAFVRQLLTSLPAKECATVIALTGDLGAGKTTLVKELSKALGVSEEVTSPTFNILKGYETENPTWRQLLHMDAYRIETLDELRPLRFTELLGQSETLFCIEWAENIKEALPENCMWLHLSDTDDEDIRTIKISGPGLLSN